MNEMTVANYKLNFDPTLECNEAIVDLPEESEVLSVEIRDNKPTLYINYMAPTENFEIDLSKRIHFIICKREYTEVDVKRYRYIGNVNVGRTIFAVFCN